jgi:transposase InsO family protein
MLLITSTNSSDKHNTWYLNSGASSHMSCQHNWLHDFKTNCPTRSVILGNNAELMVHGRGTVQAITHIKGRDVPVTLQNVLFVPDLAKNLVSTSRLIALGCHILLNQHGASIQHPLQSFPPLVACSCDNMIVVELEPRCCDLPATALIATGIPCVTLDQLHACMGHIGADRLRLAAAAAPDITLVAGSQLSTCTPCIKAKQHRRPISSGPAPRSDVPMHLIHSDVCGPFPTPSFTGMRYFVSFIDDCTRHATVYFMKAKSEVLDKLRDFIASLPSQVKVRQLRSDHGGEYTGKLAQTFLRSAGIEHVPSPPYTPEYNGVAERFNHTIVEMARAMLFASDLPWSFWAEAIQTGVHIHNRSPTKANNNCSPHQVWLGSPPGLLHLHPFGACAHLLLPPHKCDKLVPRSVDARYLRPAHDPTIHRMWVPGSRTTTMSHNVVFSVDTTQVSTVVHNDKQPIDHTTIKPPLADKYLDPGLNHTFNNTSPSSPAQHAAATATSITDILGEDFGRTSLPPVSPRQCAPDHASDVSPPPTPTPATSTRIPAPPPTRPPSARSTKAKPPTHLVKTCNFARASTTPPTEPRNHHKAMSTPEALQWLLAMQKELKSIADNATWNLVPMPKGHQAVDTRWIFKVKYHADGSIECYKAHFVAKGYSQIFGIDYNATYALVVCMEAMQYLLAFAVLNGFAVHLMDVATAFLHADVDEEIYVQQPEGFILDQHPDFVCRLNKSLYGLKQAPLLWNQTIDRHLHACGFVPTDGDPCVYSQ